jgi:hypothetical protein
MNFTTIGKAKKQTRLSYIGSVNKSAKLAKNGKINHQYTYGVYLAPAKESGYNVCPYSTAECRKGCLATSGRAGMEFIAGKTKTQNCRINKTRLFYEQPEFYMAWLIAELKVAQAKAIADGFGFSVRLNCTSDIDWQNVKVDGKSLFEMFPEVTFYDYTKNPNKFIGKADNYHLTFSYTGRNWHLCEALLNSGFNVAMVFDAKNESELPAMYKGYKVVNGDITDYRVDDSKGVIVGLKWKRIANKQAEKEVLQSCFVVKKHEYALSNVQEIEVLV